MSVERSQAVLVRTEQELVDTQKERALAQAEAKRLVELVARLEEELHRHEKAAVGGCLDEVGVDPATTDGEVAHLSWELTEAYKDRLSKPCL